MSGPFGSSQFMYATGAEEGQSLRFEDGDSPYFSFTFGTPTNQIKWTMSFWCKRGEIGREHAIYGATNGGGETFFVAFYPDDIEAYISNGRNHVTNAVFRDPSAWYHIVQVFDSANATADDRFITYVNGVRQTTSTNSVALNDTTGWNTSGVTGYFGKNYGAWFVDSRDYFDGYLANVTFIDGQALTPTSFGEYDGTLWKPKSDTDIQSLTFGTNGFYLPFKQTTEAEGFSTVTYTGTSAEHHVEGVGFEPDFVWIKSRTSAESHWLYDSVRGADEGLKSNATSSENSNLGGLEAFESSGFELGTYDGVNDDGKNYVAWCWDAGSGSAASNTDGSITSNVKANTTNGFSIVTYTGNATSGATVGHGLGSNVKVVLCKARNSSTYAWNSWHVGLSDDHYIALNSTSAEDDSVFIWDTSGMTSSVFTHGSDTIYMNASGVNYVAYCFAEVSGYSKFGSYSGTGAAGNAVTGLGFKPAFVMIKRTDSTDNWVMFDNTRDPVNSAEKYLLADSSQAEATFSTVKVDFDSDGFTLQGSANSINNSSGTYIYMAFADTRDATFFGDTSGNSNNWTPNKLNNTDVVPDSPVIGGNFATLNPLDRTSTTITLSEGNLRWSKNNGSFHFCGLTIPFPQSGKWYAEARAETTITAGSGGSVHGYNLVGQPNYPTSGFGNTGNGVFVYDTNSSSGSTIRINSTNGGGLQTVGGGDAGDIMQFAFDADTGKCWLGKNGTWYGGNTGVPAAITLANLEAGNSPIDTFTAAQMEEGVTIMLGYSDQQKTAGWRFNAGADSSFQGVETPQGNTDDNGVGDFYYAPPSGFLALTTGNMPTPDITAPDEYFNTVLYSGNNASSHAITGVNFQPDFLWVKNRGSASGNHALHDAVRGSTGGEVYFLKSNSTDAQKTQADGDGVLSFDSDGFTVGYNNSVQWNNTGYNYVAWNWLAGNGTVSNTDGSITSTVSANTDAGCSVISYTGNGTSGATFGHGLGKTPSHFIIKRYSTSEAWVNWHTTFSSTQYLRLYQTTAIATATNIWNSTLPSSSVITIGNGGYVNTNGENYICYAFSEIEGYSKFGSYTGNGSTNFVHCGFRPAWIMIRRTNTAAGWGIIDNKRNPYNSLNSYINTNSSSAEASGTAGSQYVDFLSNGFKCLDSSAGFNASGDSYIFLAFAEAPFSKANAR